MSKFVDYMETKNRIEELQKKLDSLSEDDAVRNANEFQNKLGELMKEYGYNSGDVLRMWNLETGSAQSGGKGKERKRSTRSLKTYKNPETGEVVETRGGNHKTLNAWRKQYGRDTVNSWAA